MTFVQLKHITNKDRLCEERTTILSWVGQARDLA